MNVAQIVDQLRTDPDFTRNLTRWHTVPARPARFAGFPDALDDRLTEALKKRGLRDLYTHQRAAVDAVLKGEDICVVTPTASGKTLCYNLPILNRLMQNPDARAMYLFPTKALSQDQVNELQTTIDTLDVKIGTYTFDGDTPASARRAIRNAGHIVVTNPDMLHAGILPHHTIWMRLFENLEYIVIDELHHYRGVFGSHLANVVRRLKRICEFYGAKPQFICCSATIDNPKEMAERIVEKPITLIDNNGAPTGEKHFLFYNPPVVNAELGIRESSVRVASRIATRLFSKDVQSIIFARSRLRVEILTTYIREAVAKMKKSPSKVKGYRGGYLPTERRDIEKGLRNGEILTVVSTNALELGIDIGSLDVCIMTGYSGSIASTWQQAGRAGRRSGTSLVILVASSAPLDQYIISHPEYFFEQNPESATVDPNNLIIAASHIKCATFEIPFKDEEAFGGYDKTSVGEVLNFLEEEHVVRHVKDKWHWSCDAYPAEDISLRTAAPGNVVVLDTTQQGRVIGEVDLFAAPMELYQNAIYIHQTQQYTIDELDLEDRKAYARPVESDYYTDAQMKVDLKVIDNFESAPSGKVSRHCGEVSVTWMPSIYKKIKFNTHENVGWGEINLPETTMHTASYWIEFNEETAEELGMKQDQLSAALHGFANALRQVAPVHVLCDPTDIRASAMLRAPFSERPVIYLYESYPGGVGFSEKLYNHHTPMIQAVIALLSGCPCKHGCPSCTGPALETGDAAKQGALKLAKMALGEEIGETEREIA